MSDSNEISIYIIGGDDEIYQKLFPKEGNEIITEFGVIKKKFNKKNMFEKLTFNKNQLDVIWIGYKYPDINEENSNKLLYHLYQNIINSQNKKIIIIKFGNSCLKQFQQFFNKFSTDFPCILFCFTEEEDTIEENYFESFKKPQYISYIYDKIDKNDPDKRYNKIISYLWEKDCYYNEAGNCSFMSIFSSEFII